MTDTFDELMNAINEKESKSTPANTQTQPAPASDTQTDKATAEKNNSLHGYSKQFEEVYGKKK